MNLFDLNNDNITMNIGGIDIEMKPAMCFGKVYDNWFVSKCGKTWSMKKKCIITGQKTCVYSAYSKTNKTIRSISFSIMTDEENWWGDG